MFPGRTPSDTDSVVALPRWIFVLLGLVIAGVILWSFVGPDITIKENNHSKCATAASQQGYIGAYLNVDRGSTCYGITEDGRTELIRDCRSY